MGGILLAITYDDKSIKLIIRIITTTTTTSLRFYFNKFPVFDILM